MSTIKDIRGTEILDSRGNPTVAATVVLHSGATGFKFRDGLLRVESAGSPPSKRTSTSLRSRSSASKAQQSSARKRRTSALNIS